MDQKNPTFIHRPADGNYVFDTDEQRKNLRAAWRSIFGEDYIWQRDTLYDRVSQAVWNNVSLAHTFGFQTEVDGWTRPLTDILLDLVELTKRRPLSQSMSFLRTVLGEDLAAEFVTAVAKSNVFFVQAIETMDDAERQKSGLLRVGPRSEPVRFTHEELKILNTVMTDRGGWPAVDSLVKKLAEAVS